MEAGACSSKVLPLKPARAMLITTPLTLPKKKNEKGKHKEDMSDIDSCEDLGDEELPSDLEADGHRQSTPTAISSLSTIVAVR